MLELGEKNIEEIAEEIGIANGNYLSSLFKKRYGITPSQYKKSKLQM